MKIEATLMDKLQAIMAELERLGSDQCRKIYRNHGAPENTFGVKVGDMKKVARKIKGDQELALALYATGNGDAQYLAGMIAEPQAFTRVQLDAWAATASWYMVSEYSVPGVAAESEHAWACGDDWIDAPEDKISSAGWTTLAANVSIHDDDAMDFAHIAELVRRAQRHESLYHLRGQLSSRAERARVASSPCHRYSGC